LRRYLAILAIALLLVGLAGSAAFAEDKIGYINSERIRFEYTGARDIETQLEASVADWRAQAREMESEVETLINELQSQRLLLSDEAARQKETVIQEKQVAFEGFLNEVWGVSGLAARKEAELWQPVFDRINAIISELGVDGDYTMIFDAAQMGIVYAGPGTDLTAEIVGRLNGETE
jgi:outer membrane protein